VGWPAGSVHGCPWASADERGDRHSVSHSGRSGQARTRVPVLFFPLGRLYGLLAWVYIAGRKTPSRPTGGGYRQGRGISLRQAMAARSRRQAPRKDPGDGPPDGASSSAASEGTGELIRRCARACAHVLPECHLRLGPRHRAARPWGEPTTPERQGRQRCSVKERHWWGSLPQG
jgi:hypothetical protein